MLADAEEKRFGQVAGRYQAELNAQMEKLGELSDYRHDYASKAQGIAGIHSAHWKDYQGFLSRLDNAVRSQQRIVQDCEQALETHRRRWLVKRQRLESLERVRERFEQEERVEADRREQRRLDDLTTRPDRYE